MQFNTGDTAIFYLYLTLAAGTPVAMAPYRRPVVGWLVVLASWILSNLIASNLPLPYSVLVFSVMDFMIFLGFAAWAHRTKLGWIAAFSLVHFAMLVLHLICVSAGLAGDYVHLAGYNAAYAIALCIVLSSVASWASGRISNIFSHTFSGWRWSTAG